MKKILTIIYILLVIALSTIPKNTYALNISIDKNSYIQILDTDVVSDCSSENTGILGSVNDEDSVAWLLQQILNYIKILGPSIAIVLGSVDFAKAIIASDEENMKKTQKKFINRLVAAALLFFVPLLVQIMLSLFGFTTDVTCGLK